MFFRTRLIRLINQNVQIATSAGMYEGSIEEVSTQWLKLNLVTTPGYPPVRITVFLKAIGFVRIV